MDRPEAFPLDCTDRLVRLFNATGMIGTKVAAAAPERVQSLTVLSSTGFGHHMVLSMLWSPLLALKVRGHRLKNGPQPRCIRNARDDRRLVCTLICIAMYSCCCLMYCC